ncbi:hypothetical protein AAFF_G00260290 [Aldrovandia affinis]|uniref:Uncharacterized protein n=1 Tax=Aldrovandia affinis TaxID=143900 RepID=A0AAD7RBY8_9TELE|nr:hypothetical protein AAFF_G00260290 [Aldrovandia affinis]
MGHQRGDYARAIQEERGSSSQRGGRRNAGAAGWRLPFLLSAENLERRSRQGPDLHTDRETKHQRVLRSRETGLVLSPGGISSAGYLICAEMKRARLAQCHQTGPAAMSPFDDVMTDEH